MGLDPKSVIINQWFIDHFQAIEPRMKDYLSKAKDDLVQRLFPDHPQPPQNQQDEAVDDNCSN